MSPDASLKWLSLLVAALTLWTLWESHQLHKLEFEERCERRRERNMQGGGYPPRGGIAS